MIMGLGPQGNDSIKLDSAESVVSYMHKSAMSHSCADGARFETEPPASTPPPPPPKIEVKGLSGARLFTSGF